MVRNLLRFMLLAGLFFGLSTAEQSSAQSKKKLGGPTVELEGLKSQVFDFWKEQKKVDPFLWQFLLPKDLKTEQDAADMLIYPTTGKTDEIIVDWKNRWLAPKGFKLEEVARTETFKVGPATLTKLTIMGDYLRTAKPTDSITEAKKMTDYRMQAYVFDCNNKKYVIQLVGPYRTVGLHMSDMEVWVKAFK